MKNNKLRNTAILYPTGICNLQCRYCNIDKNPILIEIDKKLGESFQDPNYYFNRIKQYFPQKGQLHSIETWGGEPFIYMDRIFPLLHQLINYYPYFDNFFSSTNFSFPQWNDQIFGLLNQFKDYPYRDFSVHIQLSCDGPEYINDAGRGIGTTQKCLDNFKVFIEKIPNHVPENVTLLLSLKPTLDIYTLKELNSKEKIVEYYKFFEDNFIAPIRALGFSNVGISDSVPNIAVPTPATVEDGIFFKEFCEYCLEIDNNIREYLNYYNSVMPYPNHGGDYKNLTYKDPCMLCGSGMNLIGFLPDNMISICHEGFTQFVETYKQHAANGETEDQSIVFNKFVDNNLKLPLCVTDEEYEKYEDFMAGYIHPNTTARLMTMTALIINLAMANQVDKKYLNQEEALKAARFLSFRTAYCIKDNLNTHGSTTLPPIGTFKLLLNGAMDIIMQSCQEVN